MIPTRAMAALAADRAVHRLLTWCRTAHLRDGGVAIHAIADVIGREGLALVKGVGRVRLRDLTGRHIPANPIRIERQPVLDRSMFGIMANQGQPLIARPKGVVNDGLVGVIPRPGVDFQAFGGFTNSCVTRAVLGSAIAP